MGSGVFTEVWPMAIVRLAITVHAQAQWDGWVSKGCEHDKRAAIYRLLNRKLIVSIAPTAPILCACRRQCYHRDNWNCRSRSRRVNVGKELQLFRSPNRVKDCHYCTNSSNIPPPIQLSLWYHPWRQHGMGPPEGSPKTKSTCCLHESKIYSVYI